MTKIQSIGKDYMVRDYLRSDEYSDITAKMFDLTKSMFGKVDKSKFEQIDVNDPLKTLTNLEMGLEDIDQNAMTQIYDQVCCSICEPPLETLNDLPAITDAKIHRHVINLYMQTRDEINALMEKKG